MEIMSVEPTTQPDYIRSAVTLIFVIGYFVFLFAITGILPAQTITQADGTVTTTIIDLEENPVITLLLGILSTALALIIQFYYRRGTPQ